ncbi:hypothetical protein GWI33_007239 [Rhynchophorus ferrugineus]|uniref:DUF5641 domain-containing protein n=1 Tax=Rhynchophorus ferrugineus TaxID=354439 RepID=A0A834IF49_RHYFE|nr:hypothetical protein GWI33_007239 [Rhynchophorus ferrugineus]
MILLLSENLPPTVVWRIARLEKLFPGPNGLSGVSSQRTPRGTFSRLVGKLSRQLGDGTMMLVKSIGHQ